MSIVHEMHGVYAFQGIFN